MKAGEDRRNPAMAPCAANGDGVIIRPGRNPIVAAAFAGLRAGDTPGKVAHAKEAPVRSEKYRRLVAAMPCIHCGIAGRSQAAHVPPSGKGIKQDDRETFPLCADGPGTIGCHARFDQFKLWPKQAAVAQGLRWARETRAAILAAGLWPKGLETMGEKR